MELFTIIIPIALLVGFHIYLRSKERRIMIEKGLDPSLVNIYTKSYGGTVFLFTGIILLGIASGFSSGVLLARLLNVPTETKELVILCLIIFTGFSCFLCYYLSRRRQ